MADDREIRDHIGHLVAEERELRTKLARGDIRAADEHDRLRQLEVELDQCWDLLRQRDARREFGENPRDAAVRPEGVVENYEG